MFRSGLADLQSEEGTYESTRHAQRKRSEYRRCCTKRGSHKAQFKRRSDLPGLLWILGLRQTRCHRNNSAVAFACYRMRRGLAQLLPEGHQSIEKRSCKQPDSNARPKHQNVSFSAHCRSVWGLLSLVLLTTGNVGPSSPTKCSAS